MMTSHRDTRRKVLVAWDGSPLSAAAFPTADVLGRQLDAEVEILHVVSEGTRRLDIESALREVGLDGLEQAALRIEAGNPVEEIVNAATDRAIQLVVLTTHAGTGNKGPYLGSVVEGVMAKAVTPLMLLRPQSPPVQRLQQLLLPVDGTPTTATALQPAADLALQLGARLDLLYVAGPAEAAPRERGSMGPPRYVDQPQHEWPAWASEAAERWARLCAECPPEVEVQMFLAHGDIATEIEQFASEHGSDAIVLVRRSRLQRGRARVLRAVLANSTRPVLLCAGPEHGGES